MEFTIDISIKEARAIRSIAKQQSITGEELIQRLIRQFITGQIRGAYRKLFDQMTYSELEETFGTIEDLFPE